MANRKNTPARKDAGFDTTIRDDLGASPPAYSDPREQELELAGALMAQATRAAIILIERGDSQIAADVLRLARDRWEADSNEDLPAPSADQRIASAIEQLRAAWAQVLQAPNSPGYQNDDEGRFENAHIQIENVLASLEEWECRERAPS